MEKFKALGTDCYSAEQQRKKVLLNHLLNAYNDGRKKSAHIFRRDSFHTENSTLYFHAENCTLLWNRIGFPPLENIIKVLDENTLHLSLKEKAAYAAKLFQEAAAC